MRKRVRDPDFARASFRLRWEGSSRQPRQGGTPWAGNAKTSGSTEPAAGNGILNRRLFLERTLLAGAAGVGAGALSPSGAFAEPLTVPRWSKEPGANFSAYGQPSAFRGQGRADLGGAQQSGHARHRQLAHPAPAARRHDHAERAALRAQPCGRAGHRSRAASPGDPRAGARSRSNSRSRTCRAIRAPRASPSWNAPATAARSIPRRRGRSTCRPSMGCCPARTGPASSSRRCWTKPASIRAPNGCWPKAPTPPA